ncbi:MAG: hypothetical protein AAGA56_26625 [Myxococcota bacterium]
MTSPSISPQARLAELDPRAPVPLLPMMAWHQKQNMMQHLVAVQQVVAGVAEEDWGAVQAAAASIGSSPQMSKMCEHMGAGAPGFTAAALDFHRKADTIVQAASRKSRGEVLRATAQTLEACTQCHATYRQQVVDGTAWPGPAPHPPPH